MRAWCLVVLAGCGRIGFTPGPGDARGTTGDGGTPSGDASTLSSGLRFLFHLDGITGADVPEASGQDGRIYNEADVVPSAGKLGGALHFDGVAYASFVIFPSSDGSCAAAPALGGSLTVAAWVSFDSLHDWGGYTLGDVALMQGTVGGTQGVWGLGATNGCGADTAGFEVAFDDAHRFVRCGTTALLPATWYFLAGVYDATARTVRIYVDGVEDTGGQAPGSGAIGASLNPYAVCPYLGASSNQGYLLRGSLDEVRIYDRALSPAEVRALYVVSGG